MKTIVFAIIMLVAPNLFAQDNLRQEINTQVWKPFIQAFNDNNTAAFMAIHSKDLVRSSRDARQILDWQSYFTQQQRGDNTDKTAKRQRKLDLRFTERIANKNQAIDVGIYKTTYQKPDGTTQSFYGRFHVVMRKQSDGWKILVDTDSSENNTITEKDFLAAAPIE